jgi:hypothetical protein
MNVKGSRRDIFSQVGLWVKCCINYNSFWNRFGNINKSCRTKAQVRNPIAALQLALTLEYLEDEFYQLGLASGVIPGRKR